MPLSILDSMQITQEVDIMATTLSAAKAKLAAKIPYMSGNYNRSMGDFFGVSDGAIASSPPGSAYSAKVRPGMEDRWETGLRRAFNV